MPKKLNRLTQAGFYLPHASNTATRQVETTSAENFPAMHWPDGQWCLPANIYMLHLWEKGLSRRGRGGTLGAYAANLAHLLRFCHRRELDIHELADTDFIQFIHELREDLHSPNGARVRDDSTVCAIGANCLDFIDIVGKFRQDTGLIGPEGRIRGYQVSAGYRYGGRRLNDMEQGKRWYHPALPQRDPMRRRVPITSSAISLLRSAVLTVSTSMHQRIRRYAMLTALEVTGGRRIEVASLRVVDVVAAARSEARELRLLTAKRPGGKEDYRYIPVAAADLHSLLDYIRVNRRSVMRKTLGSDHDHGFVFINTRTGAPLRANTLTQEVHLLAKTAKIAAVTCPHMFRHRYITKIFVQLIEQHEFENKDDFRRALLSTKQLKQKLLQWTGQRRLESLDRYIDLAFEEIGQIGVSVRRVLAAREIEAVHEQLTAMARELEAGDRPVTPERLKILAAALMGVQSENKTADGAAR